SDHSDLQKQYSDLQAGMESIVKEEIDNTLTAKTNELAQLKEELQKAKDKIRGYQRSRRSQTADVNNVCYLDTKDDSFFAGQCADLYDKVQNFCTNFSMLAADTQANTLSRIKEETVRDMLESVTLDDSGVRRLIKDRNRRRDVFMAIMMRI